LDNKKLNEFKELLQSQLNSLLGEAEKTITGMETNKESFPDPTDRASLESNRSFTLKIRERESKLINKIKGSIEKIEKGEFGLCEECNGEIGYERLKARPVTALCIECKTKQEEEEKRKKQ
jgi:DnaK suppressor protein